MPTDVAGFTMAGIPTGKFNNAYIAIYIIYMTSCNFNLQLSFMVIMENIFGKSINIKKVESRIWILDVTVGKGPI